MSNKISVLISTFNRANILNDTLTSFAEVINDLDVEWVIVDNNSDDATMQVITKFENQLNIKYIFQEKPGKNAALNKAIDGGLTSDIIVFTDDDITPNQNWLYEIDKACSYFSQYSVFGGKILLKWPLKGPAPWATTDFIKMFAFGYHDLGNSICEYDNQMLPFGGNFWIKNEILKMGFRFNENVGPKPKNRIMGSESSFLNSLRENGYQILYYPNAEVTHRIQDAECQISSLYKRSFRLGRGEIYVSGIPRKKLYNRSKFGWRVYSISKLLFGCFLFCCSFLWSRKSIYKKINSLRVIGNAWESLNFDIS
jgi:glycosyltransferase involved in cell wall biosynthesis